MYENFFHVNASVRGCPLHPVWVSGKSFHKGAKAWRYAQVCTRNGSHALGSHS